MLQYHSLLVVLFLAALSCSECFLGVSSLRSRSFSKSVSMGDLEDGTTHKGYLESVAKISAPKQLPLLLELLQESEEETIVSPSNREDLNPFLIPLSQNKDGTILCYIRWPTQKEDMDLQLVRTSDVGIILESMSTDQYCHRKVAEADFYSTPKANSLMEKLNKDGQVYTAGDYMPFLKSGKFDAISQEDLRLIIDRYILTKVGAFPDCFERLATNFLKSGSTVSALVTCERAVSVFYGWGHPLNFHANMLRSIPGREQEGKDAARAAFGMPMWTVARNAKELEELAVMAGFTGSKIVGEMHAFRATDPRTDEVGEGLDPIQVTLDQAAHLMDAVALGAVEGGWKETRELIAEKYREATYEDMAEFIVTN